MNSQESAEVEWKPKALPPGAEPRQLEVKGLPCWRIADLQDGTEVTLESPNFPNNYPNRARCSWGINVPAGEEVKLWCEKFDVARGDKFRIYQQTNWISGHYPEGFGDTVEAVDRDRMLFFSFKSNRWGTAGGFRCQVSASKPTTNEVATPAPGCTTESGTRCVFPFKFHGHNITSCTTVDGDARPWCSTRTDASGHHVGGHWGYCSATCSGEVPTTTTTTTTAAPVAPSACQCGVKGGSDRIVGGQTTEAHEYPWQVGLVNGPNGRTPFCGGTLISTTHVLTAAHCTAVFNHQPNNIYVILGEHVTNDNQVTRVGVAEVIADPNYNPQTVNSDFSILRLARPVSFTSTIRPACLPAQTNPAPTYVGQVATVTGWGTLSSGGAQPTVLQEVNVTVTTNSACNSAYGTITDMMLCASAPGKDSCQGDSGGPLVLQENGRQALVGVVSWGAGCAKPGYPGVYARTTRRMDWLLANTQGTYSSTCARLN